MEEGREEVDGKVMAFTASVSMNLASGDTTMVMEAEEKKDMATEEKGREEVVWKMMAITASVSMNLASGNTTMQKGAEEKKDAATEEEGREEVDPEVEKGIDVNGIIHQFQSMIMIPLRTFAMTTEEAMITSNLMNKVLLEEVMVKIVKKKRWWMKKTILLSMFSTSLPLRHLKLIYITDLTSMMRMPLKQ